MACAGCGADLPIDAKFCLQCGAPQRLTCSACGLALPPAAKFCAECGTPVGARSATAGTPGGAVDTHRIAERRVCSVLFCDLVGFTTLSETRDPEAVRELLSRYFDTARTVIGRYGGVVEKFIGDAVMAVWGTPVAREGDAERAVRAALDLVAAVSDLGVEAGAELSARAGIVTGEVAVTIGATGEGMVAGDAVNTAARVQAEAEAGAVLVDEGTLQTTQGAIGFVDVGLHALKGKAEPVPLWRADRVLGYFGGQQRVDGLEAPLVGRDTELRLVKELFHACLDRGSPRLVVLTGPAGVGKSRLGWELEKYIDGLSSDVLWHRGRCLSYGDGVAFWALAEMIRRRFGIAEEDSSEVAAARLTDQLPQWLPDEAERAYVALRLARLLGVDAGDASAALGREELFAGWRLFLERMAAVVPVVLLVEDLHYADPGLLDFLEHLLDWSRDVPIYVLALTRPDLDERRPGWATARRGGTSLVLDPLSDHAMAELVEDLVPGMPEAARQAIAVQAQGIPLYAVETVRMLIDRDVVQPIDGVYRLVGDLGDLSVPATLQSLLAARLDALDPLARALVADASVLGGTFPAEALVSVSGKPEDEVRRVLSDLVRREVFAVQADPLSPERGQYGFVQGMLRQVAYDTLSRRERKTRHLVVADHLTRVFSGGGEEVSEVVARHLVDALESVPDDADVPEIRDRAVTMLKRAAERAQRTAAPATALSAYLEAAHLRLQERSEQGELEAAKLFESAADQASNADDRDQATEHFHAAADLYLRHGRPRDAARCECGVGRMLRRQGHLEEARTVIRRALEVLEEPVDADTVKALVTLAGAEIYGTPAAFEAISRALGVAQDVAAPDDVMASLLVNQSIQLAVDNRPVQAVAALREASRRAEAIDDAKTLTSSYSGLSDVLVNTDPVAAVEAARVAVAACRRLGLAYALPGASANLVQAALLTGDWQEAEQEVEQLLAEQSRGTTGSTFGSYVGVMWFAVRGELDRCDELVEAMADLAVSEDAQDVSAHALAHALIAVGRRDWQSASDHAGRILERIDELGLGVEFVRWGWAIAADAALELQQNDEALRLLEWLDAFPTGRIPLVMCVDRERIRARHRAATGDARAAATFESAVRMAREFPSVYHLAVCLLDQADHLRTSDVEAAERLATEAHEIAQRLGAAQVAARASALLPAPLPAPAR